MSKETKAVLATAVFFLVVAVASLFYVNNRKKEAAALEQEIAALEDKNKKNTEIAKDKERLTLDLKSLEENLKHYVTILPSPEVATEEDLMRLVHNNCERTGIKFIRYELDPRLKKAAPAGPPRPGVVAAPVAAFEEIGLILTLEGTYAQFLEFLNHLETNETFLRATFVDIRVKADKDEARRRGPGEEEDRKKKEAILKVSLGVATFRYNAGKKKAGPAPAAPARPGAPPPAR